MGIQDVRDVFAQRLEPFGRALDVIYAEGGLMAHHDGVNSAVSAFWAAAEQVALSDNVSVEDKKEIDQMYGRIVNLTINAHTKPECVVGQKRYETLVNAL